jgi:hypothetical protein
MLITRVCCSVCLGTGFNNISFIKFSKKICTVLENTMNETGKLLSWFCLVHLGSELFWLLHATVVICFCWFNKWWCDVCSQVIHQLGFRQFLGQSGCTPYAEYGAWNTETVRACALAPAYGTFLSSYLSFWGHKSAQVSLSQPCVICLCIIFWLFGVVWFFKDWIVLEFCIKINLWVTENSAPEYSV